jgi:iron complex transport system substrate-binding protein
VGHVSLRSLGACALVAMLAAAPVRAAPVETIAADGARVALAAPAQRIVSLAPHATELVYAAGAGGKLVGVLALSDWPPAARSLRTVGDAAAIDVEGIVALKPDLVVTWPWTAPAQVERLRAFGIPILVTRPSTPQAIADEIERIGTLAGTEATARAAGRDLRARLDRVAAAHAQVSAPLAVFYQVSAKPLFTLGGDHLVSQAIALCGARNVFEAIKVPAPEVDVEAVVAARPEVIVTATRGGTRTDALDAWRRWPALPAVAQGQFVTLDADLMHRPGPRFVDGVESLCAALDQARAKLR